MGSEDFLESFNIRLRTQRYRHSDTERSARAHRYVRNGHFHRKETSLLFTLIYPAANNDDRILDERICMCVIGIGEEINIDDPFEVFKCYDGPCISFARDLALNTRDKTTYRHDLLVRDILASQ